MKEKIEANKELGLLSKKLARIMLDVPVEFNEKEYELDQPDLAKVTAIFEDLEFRRLADNLIKTFATEATTNATDNTPEKASKKQDKTSAAGAGQFLYLAVEMLHLLQKYNKNCLAEKQVKTYHTFTKV